MRSRTARPFASTTVQGTTTISTWEWNDGPSCGRGATRAQANKVAFLIAGNMFSDYFMLASWSEAGRIPLGRRRSSRLTASDGRGSVGSSIVASFWGHAKRPIFTIGRRLPACTTSTPRPAGLRWGRFWWHGGRGRSWLSGRRLGIMPRLPLGLAGRWRWFRRASPTLLG